MMPEHTRMFPPPGAVNVLYNGAKVSAGGWFDVKQCDVESLKAEGWTLAAVEAPDQTPSGEE